MSLRRFSLPFRKSFGFIREGSQQDARGRAIASHNL